MTSKAIETGLSKFPLFWVLMEKALRSLATEHEIEHRQVIIKVPESKLLIVLEVDKLPGSITFMGATIESYDLHDTDVIMVGVKPGFSIGMEPHNTPLIRYLSINVSGDLYEPLAT